MSQKFLNQLLRVEETVQVDELEAPTCMICLEPYGRLNSTTGAVELQVRLPCNHLVGTVCIATWLRDNNSCPACRATFFPAQPRPYLEHGIIGNDDPFANTNRGRMGGRDESDPIEICDWVCHELYLSVRLRELAVIIAEPLSQMLLRQVSSPSVDAAITIYIAWHLMTPDDSPTNFLEELSHLLQVSQHQIRHLYRFIYPHRMDLITPETLPCLVRPHMDSIYALLPFPDPVDSEQDDDEEGEISGRRELYGTSGIYARLASISVRLGEELSSTHPDHLVVIEELYEELIDRMDDHPVLRSRSSEVQMAVCVIMACHLMGAQISFATIARLYGVSEQNLRKGYAHAVLSRDEWINCDMVTIMGRGSVNLVLGEIPALNWPSLQD